MTKAKRCPTYDSRQPDSTGLSMSSQLDWGAAKRAADRINRLCSDAAYIAPDWTGRHRTQVSQVCEQMEMLAAALMITPKDTGSW